MENFLFFSSETNPPAGNILSRIYTPIEMAFNALFSGERYSEIIDSMAVIPVCMIPEQIERFDIRERKYVSRKGRYADFRLFVEFEALVHANRADQLQMFVQTVERAAKILAERDKTFDLPRFLRDFYTSVHTAQERTVSDPSAPPTGTPVDERLLFITRYCPDFIGGPEVEQSKILFDLYGRLPVGLSEAEKAELFRKTVLECFGVGRMRPRWLDYPDWPLSPGGIPLRFVGQTRKAGPDGILVRYRFADSNGGPLRTVIQSV